MANNNLAQVYDQAMAGINSAMAEENNNFQRAALTGDVDEQVRASQAIAGYRALSQEYHRMATEHANSMNVPPAGSEELSRRDVDLARRYGLTANELGVAKGWTANPDVCDEDRVREYVQNRQRYQRMRQTGEYRDDNGRVTR
jgi:hypothetical protein